MMTRRTLLQWIALLSGALAAAVRPRPSRAAADTQQSPWYLTYDIHDDADFASALLLKGSRLVRIGALGLPNVRFYGLMHMEATTSISTTRLGLDESGLRAAAADSGAPIVCVEAYVDRQGLRFAIGRHPGAAPTRTHLGLDAPAVQALLARPCRIVDLSGYGTPQGRRWVVVETDGDAAATFVPALDRDGIGRMARQLRAQVVRLRGHGQGDARRWDVLFAPMPGRWEWELDLEHTDMTRMLDRRDAIPMDMDRSRDASGIRVSVVMRRR